MKIICKKEAPIILLTGWVRPVFGKEKNLCLKRWLEIICKKEAPIILLTGWVRPDIKS